MVAQAERGAFLQSIAAYADAACVSLQGAASVKEVGAFSQGHTWAIVRISGGLSAICRPDSPLVLLAAGLCYHTGKAP